MEINKEFMTKLSYKLVLNEIYYATINHDIFKVRLNEVKLSSYNEPIYNNYLPESILFATESKARTFILQNDVKRIKVIDKTI